MLAAVDTKRCTKCGLIKPLSEFYSSRRLSKGKQKVGHYLPSKRMAPACKECVKERVYAAKDRRKQIPSEAERMRVLRRDHKRKLRAAQGAEPRHEIAARTKANRAAKLLALAAKAAIRNEPIAHVIRYRGVVRARAGYHRKMTRPQFVLDQRMKTAISKALRGRKSGRRWEVLVGYSLFELVEHIERQFLKGMTWANMGRWHIDHIIPKSSFPYSSHSDEAFRACWALANLRPLWAEDNLRKLARRTSIL